MAKRKSRGTRALLEEMGDMQPDFAASLSEIPGRGVKVINIVLDRIRPDPAQPRRVLPASLRDEFLMGNINARQALERWESLVAEEAQQLGRPRPDWKALLDRKPEDRAEEGPGIDPPGHAGPEEQLLRSIVATAATIRHGGQVSPITVVEVGGGSYYRIETGERRFWAHHWLNTWLSDSFDQIQCIVVGEATPWRQAAENTSREGLSSIAMARQLATLLLDLYDIQPDYSKPIANDWYRQALEYRVPRGEGSNLRAALGGIDRFQFSRIQALLRLPDSVWEIADRHRIEEVRLRPVLKVEDPNEQLQLVKMIVDQHLPSQRIQHLVESGKLSEVLSPTNQDGKPGATVSSPKLPSDDTSVRVASRWPSMVSQVPKADLNLVVEQWLKREKPEAVRDQVAAMRELLALVEKRFEDIEAED